MRDEDFAYFIKKFGEATHHQAVPPESINKYRDVLPDQLLTYWQEEGWNGYANGLFWLVNPEDYEAVLDMWLEGTPYEKVDTFHVIARSAFGDLYLCGESTGPSVTLSCPMHAIIAMPSNLKPKSADEINRKIRSFFGASSLDEYNKDDENNRPLFERALKKLGPLAPNEVYGFEPAIVAGGKMTLDHLAKLDIQIHLRILRELAPPTMPFANLDMEKLSIE